MLLDRSIVVEEQILPVGAKAFDGVAIDIYQISRIGIQRCRSSLNGALVLQDGIIHGPRNIAFLPSRLPAVGEIVVDAGLTQFTLLGSNQNYTVSGTGSVDST